MTHFTISELTASSTAQRLGIDNSPPPSAMTALNSLVNGLEAIRALLDDQPMSVDSGYRCEALERVLCAKDFAAWCKRHGKTAAAWPEYFAGKAHPKGYAADFTCQGFGTPAQIVSFLQKTPIRFDQLIQEGGANGWVHISFDPAMRGKVLTASFDKNGTPSYTNGAA